MTEPQLELVQILDGESFAAWYHGYPFRTVRWHFHPEYEFHLIVKTKGRFFVGDHIGTFAPGQLVMLGPNLPHNWVSHLPQGQSIEVRNHVIQFSATFIDAVIALLPELDQVRKLLAESRRGIQFSQAVAEDIEPLMVRLTAERSVENSGPVRIALFLRILRRMLDDANRTLITSVNYQLDPVVFCDTGMNKAIAYVRDNLTSDIRLPDLAHFTGQSDSAFSRAFHRGTGITLSRYITQLRINLASQILIDEPHRKIVDIAFDAGFNNLSNFNRHFTRLKTMTPSEFRSNFTVKKNSGGLAVSRHPAPKGSDYRCAHLHRLNKHI